MRQLIGEYKEGLNKVLGSFKKRFGFKYEVSSGYVDEKLEQESIIYFGSDSSGIIDLIEEINRGETGKAYGFFKNNKHSLEEMKENIPRLVLDNRNVFIFVELEERSRFRLEDIPGSIFIKQIKKENNLIIDVVKAKEVIEDEIIRRIEKKDTDAFNELYKKLYIERWEARSDLFSRKYKMVQSELDTICRKSSSSGAFVCFKKEKIVGFIVYESLQDIDNRASTLDYFLTVKDIYVEGKYRHRGIATRLFREVQRLADKNRVKSIRFKVWSEDGDTNRFMKKLVKKELYSVYELEV